MSDVDNWVIAARSGGAWAFERLWLEFAGPVAGYLRSRGVRAADDVTSEVFLAVFQGMPSFQGDGAAFRSWLFTIAHHKAVDELRGFVRDDRVASASEKVSPQSVGSVEDQVVADRQLSEWLDSLSASQREVVWLRFVADFSLEDVAQITGRRTGAVKQLQRRGIERLRRHLNGATSGQPVSPQPFLTIAEPR